MSCTKTHRSLPEAILKTLDQRFNAVKKFDWTLQLLIVSSLSLFGAGLLFLCPPLKIFRPPKLLIVSLGLCVGNLGLCFVSPS